MSVDVGDSPKDIHIFLPRHYRALVTIGSTSSSEGEQPKTYWMIPGMAESFKSIANDSVQIKVDMIPFSSQLVGEIPPRYHYEVERTPGMKEKSYRKVPMRLIVSGFPVDWQKLGTLEQRTNFDVTDQLLAEQSRKNYEKARSVMILL